MIAQLARTEVISTPPAITLVNKQPRTLSTDVAVYFSKRHANVIRQIQQMISNCPESFSRLHFELAEYADEQGKSRPAYSMTKDGFTLLAMGFTGPKALQFKLAYIEAFNQMAEEAGKSAKSIAWDNLPPDIEHISPATRRRCLKLAMQSAAMSGIHSQAEQHSLFIGLCRLLAEPAPAPPSGPNGPELLAFAKACLERRPDARLRALAIRNRLEQWWGVNYPDRPLPTIREVAKLLSKLFERKKGDGGHWFYKGVTFKEPAGLRSCLEASSLPPQ